MTSIPLTVVAKDEGQSIGACLDSLLLAARCAQERHDVQIDPLVVLDDCNDDTRVEVERRGVAWLASTGGKVEGQRVGCRPGPFQIFSDADIRVQRDTLTAICQVMLHQPSVIVAFPDRQPLPPRRRTALASALHLYNARRGYSSQRSWFSGKLFAIRNWQIPERAEVDERARRLSPSRFYDFEAGMRVDDIYLSRAVVRDHGVAGLREVAEGCAFFRAPETWKGMYRYYRRMRMELERMDLLFPETRAVHQEHGSRAPDLLASAPAHERAAFALFSVALLGCRVAYRTERAYYEHLSTKPCDPWPRIEETKAL
jgi:hypothetical protein